MNLYEIRYSKNTLLCVEENEQDALDNNASWIGYCAKGYFLGVFKIKSIGEEEK